MSQAQPILKIEQVSKLYQKGTLGSRRFREDVKKLFGGGRKNAMLPPGDQSSTDYLWALQDISFNVNEGEVLGILGNNGAGKSTLLKIISRIVLPTSGTVYGNGRVASLMEIGTGFHPELTGMENIFLNGSILGMRKAEIKLLLDDIIDFSGIAAHIYTPVKWYSSGMYMRLAFSVAAHLRNELLIVDEVLAVGDADFQRKCLNKMNEIANADGRTILFVSHQLQAIKNLCTRCILLEQGKLVKNAATLEVLDYYTRKLSASNPTKDSLSWVSEQGAGDNGIRVTKAGLVPLLLDQQSLADIRNDLQLSVDFEYSGTEEGDLTVGIHLFSDTGDFIFDLASPRQPLERGGFRTGCTIPGNLLNDGNYSISVVFVKNSVERLFYLESCIRFELADFRENTQWFGKWQGVVRPQIPVYIKPAYA